MTLYGETSPSLTLIVIIDPYLGQSGCITPFMGKINIIWTTIKYMLWIIYHGSQVYVSYTMVKIHITGTWHPYTSQVHGISINTQTLDYYHDGFQLNFLFFWLKPFSVNHFLLNKKIKVKLIVWWNQWCGTDDLYGNYFLFIRQVCK